MADPEDGGDTASAATSTVTTASNTNVTTDGKLMTQSQIDGIVGRAEKKAATEARASILEELGADDLDKVKKSLADAAAKAEASMSETEKLTRRNAELEAEKAEISKKAADQLAIARVTAALAPHMDLAAIRRIAPTIHVEHDATDEDLAKIVEDLREEVPGLFTTGTATSTPPGTTTQNRRLPPSRQTAESTKEDTAALVDRLVGDSGTGGGTLPLLGS